MLGKIADDGGDDGDDVEQESSVAAVEQVAEILQAVEETDAFSHAKCLKLLQCLRSEGFMDARDLRANDVQHETQYAATITRAMFAWSKVSRHHCFAL